MADISDELRKEANDAYYAYEQAYVSRVAKLPGWYLDATELQKATSSGDPEVVRAFIADMKRRRDEVLRMNIAD